MKDSGKRLQVNNNDDNIAIRVGQVSKTFNLPHNRQNSLKGSLINLLKGGDRTYEKQEVLKDISFEIKKGEFFGIVGRNGSGKSTLLKMLAGIYKPTEGNITVNGSLTPFIELGVGFNPELTGRENVFLNGALLGFSRDEMAAMYNDIVEFAELERFMDQKLKNYSSGMQVRLAFSIAIRAQSDILVLDEVLAVGDAAFQRKCYNYFMELKKLKQTVVLVSHDMGAIRRYCDQAIMIELGNIIAAGNVEKVAQKYLNLFSDSPDNLANREENKEADDSNRWGTGKIKATTAKASQPDGMVEIKAQYKARETIVKPIFGFNVYSSLGLNILEGNTSRAGCDVGIVKKNQTIELVWRFPNMLASDTYSISISACDNNVSEFYDWWNNATELAIAKSGSTAAITDPKLELIVDGKKRAGEKY